MKNTLIIMLMCLAACFILPGCEKEVVDEFPQMEEFYQESKGLVSVTVDSVKLFKSKVDGFVATYPLAVEHEKYPLIKENIKLASFRLTITFNEEWNGETHINF